MTPGGHEGHGIPGVRRSGGSLWVGMLLAVLAALWLGRQALEVNLEHACRERQWPGFERCPPLLTASLTHEQVQQAAHRLRERVRHNPGDAWAMAGLVNLPGTEGDSVLAAATRLSPHRPEVLVRQAQQAIAQQAWTLAVPRLVLLATHHGHGNATRSLAHLVALAPQEAALQTALRGALQLNSDWLDKALRAMPAEQLPMAAAMPLVSDMVRAGKLTPDTGLLVIRQLKSENLWRDAHAVWLALWKRPLDLLFNGDFEQRFVPGGFDWEVGAQDQTRAGVQVERVGRGERGQVLQLRFTGRALRTPLVHQDLMLPPGAYRLEGEFQSTDLRSEAGLAWVVTCALGDAELVRTAPLGITGRDWRPLDLKLSVPATCPGARLTLQTQAEYEARTGLRGEILFDRMRLTRIEPAGRSQP